MFKDDFKYFKSKWIYPDLNRVIDFDKANINIKEFILPKENLTVKLLPGIKPIKLWKCFEICSHPGIIFIRNPFTSVGQRYWVAKCLQDYTRQPNIKNFISSNLDDIDKTNDWWLSYCSSNNKINQEQLRKLLRWVTLGYHHDWNTKIYQEDMKTKFPIDLKILTQFFANILGFENYSPEAAIVNYYPIGSTLAGHTDHSESDLNAPLFSFSFGQTAIFLIGGLTREERPSALFIKSGDVIVMSKESRLCYHAVPRIMECKEHPWNNLKSEIDILNNRLTHNNKVKQNYSVTNDWPEDMDSNLWIKCFDENFWTDFNNYLSCCRININVRQVLKEGQFSL